MSQPCSQASAAAGEALDGTGCPGTTHWIGLEYCRPWRPRGVVDTELPAPVAAWLAAQKSLPDTRPLLIRQRGRRGQALLYANIATGRVHRFELDRYRDVLDLPWHDLRAGRTDQGLTRERPILVCTHSARDHCCGLHGAGVARALLHHAPGRAWQCTHLGGHRFAATLVALPHGVHFGRVRADEAEALVRALDDGSLYDLDRVRGEVALSAPEQAAVLHVRRQLGERRLGALRARSEPPVDGVHAITVHQGTTAYPLRVVRARGPASAPPSCGADPAPIPRWTVTAIE